MNNPNPTGTVAVPSVTPTIGATVGAILGALVTGPAAAVGIPPIITAPIISGFGAWLAHFLHSKLGTPE